ncbi:MAG: alpha/beta fold hydrolase [Parasphingopyxis sp.]|nr:alpha/beta fold hydrolase [Sphingomonadales bacterium]
MAGASHRHIAVTLLGPLTLTCDGEPLGLPASRKTRALFVYLLREPRPQRRERLCEIFFDIPDDPRAALRWSLSKIRSTLGDCADALQGDRDSATLDAGRFTLDIDRLAHAPDRAMLPVALETPLPGLDGAGSGFFESWLAAERAAIDTLRADWLRRAARSDALTPAERDRCRAEADRIGEETGEQAEEETEAAALIPPPPGAVEQDVRFCLASDGTRIAYTVTGEGPPLVKAANWLNHLELDWTSPLWGHLLAGLSQAHSLVRYDERGNGLSDWDVEELSFDSFLDDLETVVETVGLGKFPLIGLSQGCAVSICYAARHPERVSRLVLIGGYSCGWRHFASPEEAAQREAVITLAQHGWGQDNPVYRQLFSQTFFPQATAEELDWFNDFQRRTACPENAVRFLRTFADIDVRSELPKVKCPTLVVHSRNDQRVPIEQAIELAATIPGASLVTLDSDSHVPLGREPASKRLIEAVGSFLG